MALTGSGLVLATTTAASEEPSPLLPPASELIVGVVAFTLLFLFLRAKVFPVFERTFADRSEAIEGAIARADTDRAEAAQLLARYRQQLGEAREEALSFEGLRASVMAVAARGVKAQRFKGLGEMNPSQLYDTTMDASKRTLQQVTVEDAAAADLTFAMLMGEKVEPRREFIEANARSVVNLDV